MAKLANLARMTVSSAPGTGSSITLGSAVAGHITFVNAGIANGNVITYAIRDGANSEIGTATYSTTGPSLTGRTVLNSTNGNAAINASANAEVFITASASDFAEKANVASPAFTGIGSFGTSPALAAAGTTQSTATAITNQVSIVTTGTGGIVLPASLPVGTEITVANATFNAINVYPNSGATIGRLAANAAFSLPSGAYLTFLCGSPTYWFPAAAAYV